MKRISVSAPDLRGNTERYVLDCVKSTWVSSKGDYIPRFERMFAQFCGVKHAVACNNGTTALHLALAGMNIGQGDEVIVPDLTYIASANAVRYCGADPVFADSDLRTFNVDVSSIERSITSRTKAIMAVHLYGHPCDMHSLRSLSRQHGIALIEDAAEAHGASIDGRRAGGLGDVAAFSFFGNKIVTTGEGGMLTTDDDVLAARLRMLCNQGMDPDRRYWFPVVGFNYRMTNVAAAIGVAQMERVEELLEGRQRVRRMYDEQLAGIPSLVLPTVLPGFHHSFWMYTVRLIDSAPISRDRIIVELESRGIETRPAFFPMHVLPPYLADGDRFRNATTCGRQGLNLPTHSLLSEDDVARVCRELRDLLNDRL